MRRCSACKGLRRVHVRYMYTYTYINHVVYQQMKQTNLEGRGEGRDEEVRASQTHNEEVGDVDRLRKDHQHGDDDEQVP